MLERRKIKLRSRINGIKEFNVLDNNIIYNYENECKNDFFEGELNINLFFTTKIFNY